MTCIITWKCIAYKVGPRRIYSIITRNLTSQSNRLCVVNTLHCTHPPLPLPPPAHFTMRIYNSMKDLIILLHHSYRYSVCIFSAFARKSRWKHEFLDGEVVWFGKPSGAVLCPPHTCCCSPFIHSFIQRRKSIKCTSVDSNQYGASHVF